MFSSRRGREAPGAGPTGELPRPLRGPVVVERRYLDDETVGYR